MRNDFALDNFLLEKKVLRHMEPPPVTAKRRKPRSSCGDCGALPYELHARQCAGRIHAEVLGGRSIAYREQLDTAYLKPCDVDYDNDL